MANIIPKLTADQIKKIEPRSERKVYESLLEELPNNWLVIHSLEFIVTTTSSNSHGDREADFVVFAPEYGVLVIEVKGGGIKYDSKDNKWYSEDKYSNTHEIKDPVKQAKDAKYEILKHLKDRMPKKKILLGHGALFPDINNLSSLVSPSSTIEILGKDENLLNIKKWIVNLFKYWAGNNSTFDPLGLDGINIANEIYGRDINIQQTLASKIEEEIEKQIELTNQQKNILRQLKKRPEAIIEGGAGTGKTVLALDHAITLAKQGLKVLLLCYNEKLGDVLKEKSIEHQKNLHSMNFHQLCSWRIRQVENDKNRNLLQESELEYPGEDKYKVLMPNALIESYDISPIEYDVIIVDEGQDFEDLYWYAIEDLRDRGSDISLYIFKDSNQAIYTSVDELPIVVEPLYLFDNCRNTAPIHNLAYQYYEGEEMKAPNLAGEPINFLYNENKEIQAKLIDKEVSMLITEQSIKPKDIAVIVLDNYKEAEELLKKSRNNKLWAFQVFSPKSNVLVETAMRFKGLEEKIIFLWILDSTNMDEKLLYVSISRARFRLWIVGDKGIDVLKESKELNTFLK